SGPENNFPLAAAPTGAFVVLFWVANSEGHFAPALHLPCHGASVGNQTKTTVPLRPCVVRVRRRMVPLFFSTSPRVIQSPNPVPVIPLVVTNGSKRRARIDELTPGPVSAIVIRTPRRPVEICVP